MFQSFNRRSIRDLHAYRISEEARAALIRARAEVATTAEYVDWLEGYIKNGGKITHVRDGDYHGDIVIIRKDMFLPALCGAESLTVIVPEGKQVNRDSKWNHNTLYVTGGSTPRAHVTICEDTIREMATRDMFKGSVHLLQQVVDTDKERRDEIKDLSRYKPSSKEALRALIKEQDTIEEPFDKKKEALLKEFHAPFALSFVPGATRKKGSVPKSG